MSKKPIYEALQKLDNLKKLNEEDSSKDLKRKLQNKVNRISHTMDDMEEIMTFSEFDSYLSSDDRNTVSDCYDTLSDLGQYIWNKYAELNSSVGSDEFKESCKAKSKKKVVRESRTYSDEEMDKYYDMREESRDYQKELRKLDRSIDLSRDENGFFGVNWPARGTQSVEEAEKFIYALDQAVQFCRELNTKYRDIL